MATTNGIVFTVFALLICATRLNGDDFDITTLAAADDVINAVFPKSCPPGEFWKTEMSELKTVKCQYQSGKLTQMLTQYANDVETLGCKVDKQMAVIMGDMFGSSDYVNNPLYKRMGDDCGFCGIKPACCGPKNAEVVYNKLLKIHPELKAGNSFYFEAIKGTQCSANSGKVCSYKPLTSDEFATLQKMQPFTKGVDKSDDCNFAQFGFTEWESAKANPSFPMAEPIYNKFMCRGFNTIQPRLNCVKDPSTKQCICCCHNNFPKRQGGSFKCVQDNSGPTESICSTA